MEWMLENVSSTYTTYSNVDMRRQFSITSHSAKLSLVKLHYIRAAFFSVMLLHTYISNSLCWCQACVFCAMSCPSATENVPPITNHPTTALSVLCVYRPPLGQFYFTEAKFGYMCRRRDNVVEVFSTHFSLSSSPTSSSLSSLPPTTSLQGCRSDRAGGFSFIFIFLHGKFAKG